MKYTNVLERLKPSKAEEKDLADKISVVVKKINKNLKDGAAIVGGSGAKGTWLKGTHDVDIFVKFNYNKYNDKSDKLADVLEKALKKEFKIERLHGSRDYFRTKQHDFNFEIVPVLDIKKVEQAINITDFSPMHAQWVKKNISKLADDVRLIKQFCRAIGCYGAESYIRGFSGYVLEILIIYYKGFNGLLKAASKWKPRDIVDIKKYYKNKDHVFRALNASKLNSPLIVIDPVDKNRNAVAALSYEKFSKFILAAKDFLKKPSDNYFEKKIVTVAELKKIKGKGRLAVLEAGVLSGKEDVIGAKLLKLLEYLKKKIDNEGWGISECDWQWDKGSKALFWFFVYPEMLPELKRHFGPPVFIEKEAAKFRKKWKKIKIEKNRMYTDIKREYRKIDDFLANFVKKDKHVKELVKNIKIV